MKNKNKWECEVINVLKEHDIIVSKSGAKWLALNTNPFGVKNSIPFNSLISLADYFAPIIKNEKLNSLIVGV